MQLHFQRLGAVSYTHLQVIKDIMIKQGIKPQFNKKEIPPRPERPFRLVPTTRLTYRLGLSVYDPHPPFNGDFVAQKVRIPLKQHAGAPSDPIVSIGDQIHEGDLIADAVSYTHLYREIMA